MNTTSKDRKDKPRKVSPKEFAAIQSVSTMTIYRMLHDGQLEGAVKVRNQWRIPVDAL